MQIARSKAKIEALPPNQYTECWTCVDELTQALVKAGPVGAIALEFVTARLTEQSPIAVQQDQARVAP